MWQLRKWFYDEHGCDEFLCHRELDLYQTYLVPRYYLCKSIYKIDAVAG
jgi:hypothetical protein